LAHELRRNYEFVHAELQQQLRQSFNDPHLNVEITGEFGKPKNMEIFGGIKKRKLAEVEVTKLGVRIPRVIRRTGLIVE